MDHAFLSEAQVFFNPLQMIRWTWLEIGISPLRSMDSIFVFGHRDDDELRSESCSCNAKYTRIACNAKYSIQSISFQMIRRKLESHRRSEASTRFGPSFGYSKFIENRDDYRSTSSAPRAAPVFSVIEAYRSQSAKFTRIACNAKYNIQSISLQMIRRTLESHRRSEALTRFLYSKTAMITSLALRAAPVFSVIEAYWSQYAVMELPIAEPARRTDFAWSREYKVLRNNCSTWSDGLFQPCHYTSQIIWPNNGNLALHA